MPGRYDGGNSLECRFQLWFAIGRRSEAESSSRDRWPQLLSIGLPPIVALALNPWSGPWVNRQHLLSRLGRDSPVLYSTGGWFVWDRFDPDWKRAPMSGGCARSDDVWVDAAPR